MSEEKWFTDTEVAQRYKVSVRTVRNWRLAGLPARKWGNVVRTSERALRAWEAEGVALASRKKEKEKLKD
jgi:DNA-binding transcriptional MerR regulator